MQLLWMISLLILSGAACCLLWVYFCYSKNSSEEMDRSDTPEDSGEFSLTKFIRSQSRTTPMKLPFPRYVQEFPSH